MKFAANLSTMFPNLHFSEKFNEASASGFKAVEAQFIYGVDSLPLIIEGKKESDVEFVLMNSPYKPGPLFPPGDYSFDPALQAEMSYATSTKSMANIVHRDPIDVNMKDPPFGMACLPGNEDEFYTSMKCCMRLCDLFSCRHLHVLAGIKPKESSFEHLESTYLANLRWAVEQLEEYRVVTVIEPLCEEVKERYFLNSFEQAVEYIKDINSDHLKLLLDIYHLYKIEKDVEAGLKKYLPYAGHIQISQSPGRVDPFEQGDIDYERVLQIIKESNYQGHIGLEYYPVKNSPDFTWMEKYQD